jgi:hypothetical protein
MGVCRDEERMKKRTFTKEDLQRRYSAIVGVAFFLPSATSVERSWFNTN